MSSPALAVRFRPVGPWRIGHHSGARSRVERVLHSDSLYSALTGAMEQIGALDEWLSATVRASEPDIRISSAFPYSGQTLFVPPPRNTWPPAPHAKVRWKAAKYIPLSLVGPLLRGETLDGDRWAADPDSECLLNIGKHGVAQPPFRVALRRTAPIDRVSGRSLQTFPSACLEFAQGAGMWTVVGFRDDAVRSTWMTRLRGAFRLLADSGIGGERSIGWGRSRPPGFQDVKLPEFAFGDKPVSETHGEGSEGFWLLSLFTPGEGDKVDWSRGDYSVVVRSGRAQSPSGNQGLKASSRMIEEGSVVVAGAISGVATDVAPEGFPHPVYRNGFALAIPVPVRARGWTLAVAPAPVVDEPKPEPVPELVTETPPVPALFESEEPSSFDEPSPELPPDEDPPGDVPQIDEPPVEDPHIDEPPDEEPKIDEPSEDDEPAIEDPEPEPAPIEEPDSPDAPVQEPPTEEPQR